MTSDETDPITFELPFQAKDVAGASRIEPAQGGKPDQKLLQSVARAHAWLDQLSDGKHSSIESMAEAAKLHPKVIRQALRLAFLAPEIKETILQGSQPEHLSLAAIPFALPLRWADQQQTLRTTD